MSEASGGKATLVFLESSTGGALGVKCLVFVSQHTKDDGQTFMIETVLCSGSRVGEYIKCMRECGPVCSCPTSLPILVLLGIPYGTGDGRSMGALCGEMFLSHVSVHTSAP